MMSRGFEKKSEKTKKWFDMPVQTMKQEVSVVKNGQEKDYLQHGTIQQERNIHYEQGMLYNSLIL